jgi:hypothetical protein
MWINNYDDPEDMDYDTAVRLLTHNGYKDVTVEANKQNKNTVFCVYQHPSGEGVYYCEDEDEVIELAIGEGLSFE